MGAGTGVSTIMEDHMPLFFLIAIGAGVLTVGAVATDGRMMMRKQTAQALTFDASSYESKSDCLTAASVDGAPLSVCDKTE